MNFFWAIEEESVVIVKEEWWKEHLCENARQELSSQFQIKVKEKVVVEKEKGTLYWKFYKAWIFTFDFQKWSREGLQIEVKNWWKPELELVTNTRLATGDFEGMFSNLHELEWAIGEVLLDALPNSYESKPEFMLRMSSGSSKRDMPLTPCPCSPRKILDRLTSSKTFCEREFSEREKPSFIILTDWKKHLSQTEHRVFCYKGTIVASYPPQKDFKGLVFPFPTCVADVWKDKETWKMIDLNPWGVASPFPFASFEEILDESKNHEEKKG
jgi:hypothetical protein